MNTQIEALPVATCVASLSDLIFARLVAGTLAVGPVATWEGRDGEVIRIAGTIKLRGYFADLGIRWLCDAQGNRGIFGKGYCEVSHANAGKVAHLPQVN